MDYKAMMLQTDNNVMDKKNNYEIKLIPNSPNLKKLKTVINNNKLIIGEKSIGMNKKLLFSQNTSKNHNTSSDEQNEDNNKNYITMNHIFNSAKNENKHKGILMNKSGRIKSCNNISSYTSNVPNPALPILTQNTLADLNSSIGEEINYVNTVNTKNLTASHDASFSLNNSNDNPKLPLIAALGKELRKSLCSFEFTDIKSNIPRHLKRISEHQESFILIKENKPKPKLRINRENEITLVKSRGDSKNKSSSPVENKIVRSNKVDYFVNVTTLNNENTMDKSNLTKNYKLGISKEINKTITLTKRTNSNLNNNNLLNDSNFRRQSSNNLESIEILHFKQVKIIKQSQNLMKEQEKIIDDDNKTQTVLLLEEKELSI